MPDDITFADNLTYQAPESGDCLVVPDAQWEELSGNLAKSSTVRDVVLWTMAGVLGGGSVTCIATYAAFPNAISGAGVPEADPRALNFVMAGIAFAVLAAAVAVAAWKTGSAATADAVGAQMRVLKKGFRRLKAKS